MKHTLSPLTAALFLLLSCSVYASDGEASALPSVYSAICDISHPTNDDYRLVQEYLRNGKRDLSLLKDFAPLARDIKIIGNSEEELPQSRVLNVNCGSDEKENCVIMYSTFNRNYPNALKRVVETIERSDFRGHVLYRIGGWPNEEGGDIVLSHVPYAFKVSFFREAQRRGYKRCLWLDCSIVPIVSLNDIFHMIAEKGYLFVDCGDLRVGPYTNEEAAAALGMTLEQTQKIATISAGVIGIDFSFPVGRTIIDEWYKAARAEKPFFSSRPEQNALSLILYKLGIHDFISIKRLPHTEIGEKIQPDSLFLLDRMYTRR